jgi:hypothetical protein
VLLRAHGRVACPTPLDALHVGRYQRAVGDALYAVSPSPRAMQNAPDAEQPDRQLTGRWLNQESAAAQAPAASAHPDAADLQDDGRYLQDAWQCLHDARQCLQDALHSLPDTGLY